jgi:D-alanyl-D-alanine carboxypeptidase (penicillin-binding protein 5/6)
MISVICRAVPLFVGLLLTFAIVAAGVIRAEALETAAPRVLVFEADTGSILLSREADTPFAPGNFTKLMTAAVVFDALAKGEITSGTIFPISEHAWRTGGAPARGTTMFAAVKSKVSVADLMLGLVVDYANDAAIALAEGIAGSEDDFSQRMNALASELGMTQSRFANPTGYVEARARITLGDLLKLVTYLQSKHKDRYPIYLTKEFDWNKIKQSNKTLLLRTVPGSDGLMMAYDKKDGFGAALSVLRGDRRIILLASGFKSGPEREKEMRALTEAAFTQFSTETLFPSGAEVATVRVFRGVKSRVSVSGAGPVAVTLPVGDRADFRAKVVYRGPLVAPISKGQEVAALEVRVQKRLYQTIPLVAREDVPMGDLPDRATDGLKELLFGWW